jgi:uncharacterized membrane protein (DUF485 family)
VEENKNNEEELRAIVNKVSKFIAILTAINITLFIILFFLIIFFVGKK